MMFVIVTLKSKNVTPVGNYMELDCDRPVFNLSACQALNLFMNFIKMISTGH